MRPTLSLLLALLCAPLAVHAQPTPKTSTVRDHLWLFACPPGGDAEYLENAGYRGGSRMTPVEGAHWLDIPNLVFVTQDHTRPSLRWTEIKWKAKTTMDQWAISFESLKKVSWSAVGSSGSGGLKTLPDIVSMAKTYPHVTSVYLDDFVKDRHRRPDKAFAGRPAMSEEELKSMRAQLYQQVGILVALQLRLQPAIENLGANGDFFAGLRRWAAGLADESVDQLF